jgi:glycosyltransferase involved in cell wall biosynthesis
MGKLSIIIPTYNNAHFLPETLESIFNQDYGDYELIIVDDGSTDNTRELLEKYGNKVIYLHQENSGACSKPRNEGIKIAKGDYISIFDSDDIMKPEKIRLQVDLLENNPDVGLVFTDFCDFIGSDISQSHVSLCSMFSDIKKNNVAANEYILDKNTAYETLLIENFIGASSMMFRKSLIDEIGIFNEKLDSSEDIDFTLRASQKCNLGFVDKICHLRRLHSGSMSSKTEKVITRKLIVYGSHLTTPKSARIQKMLIDKISDLHYSLAYYYRENGVYREAMKEYLTVLKYHPNHFNVYKGIVKLLILALFKNNMISRKHIS